jgi:hypothetical protein
MINLIKRTIDPVFRILKSHTQGDFKRKASFCPSLCSWIDDHPRAVRPFHWSTSSVMTLLRIVWIYMHVWRNPMQLSIVFVLIMDAALFPRAICCWFAAKPAVASARRTLSAPTVNEQASSLRVQTLHGSTLAPIIHPRRFRKHRIHVLEAALQVQDELVFASLAACRWHACPELAQLVRPFHWVGPP